jgi:hypothetical protein
VIRGDVLLQSGTAISPICRIEESEWDIQESEWDIQILRRDLRGLGNLTRIECEGNIPVEFEGHIPESWRL